WLPEKMNTETANKLLKMIEEPPEKTLFILVSEEDDKLLPTIVSRCLPVRIPSVSREDMASFLSSRFGLDPSMARDVAGIANGNMVRAIDLARDTDNSVQYLERFKNMMRVAWKRDVQAIIAWSEETAALGRERQKSFLSYSLRLIRENFIMNLGGKENGLVYLTAEEDGFAKNFHPYINEKNITLLDREFNLAYAHVESNGNTKMIFLDLALKTMRVINQ
ncbi:MAG TPA: DNA polymerase III subunit delta, partial [Bacteroidales bacterium]|nr:DNA polymerase III subunit delta [Bacteroidales bacterium]